MNYTTARLQRNSALILTLLTEILDTRCIYTNTKVLRLGTGLVPVGGIKNLPKSLLCAILISVIHYQVMDTKVGKREFDTGANRNADEEKLNYRGFYSPVVMKRFAEYMHEHRKLEDGTLRDADNWKKGIPKQSYMESMWRHFMDAYMEHEGYKSREGMEKALCGIIFNAQGYLHELLK